MTKKRVAPVMAPQEEIAFLEKQLLETQRRLRELKPQDPPVPASSGFSTEIIDALPARIAMIDRQGVILSANEGWRDFAAHSGEHCAWATVGSNYISICEETEGILAEPARRAANAIRSILAGESREFSIDYPFQMPERARWYRLMVNALQAGEVQGAVLMHLDITEQKQAEEASRMRAQILDDIGRAVVTVTPEGRVMYANRFACELYRWEPADILGRNLVEIAVPQASQEQAQEILEHSRRGKKWTGECTVMDRDGRVFPAHITNTPHFDDFGNLVGIIGISSDETERKAVEARLRESDEKFHQLADNISDVFWFRSPDMRSVEYLSPAFEKVWGRPAEYMYANPSQWMEFIYPKDRGRVREAFDKLAADLPQLELEYRIMRPDGEIRWVHVRAFQVRDAEGGLVRLAGIISDITERKQNEIALEEAERAARETEERLGFALGAAQIGDWTRDLRTNVAHHSLRYFQCFGYQEAVPGWNFSMLLEHILPEDRGKVSETYEQAKAGAGDYSVEYRTKWADGSIHWLWGKGRFFFDEDGTPYRVAGIVAEITERKLAEEKLTASEASLAEAQALVHLGSWELDLATLTGTYSAEMYRLQYRDPALGPPTYQEFLEIVHPEDRDAVKLDFKRIQEITEPYAVEYRTNPDLGPVRYLTAKVQVHRNAEGEPVRMTGTALDVTERKLIEREILVNEQRFRLLVEATAAIVWHMSPAGEFEADIPGWEAFTGQIFEEYRGWGWLDAVHPEDQEETARAWLAAVSSRTVFEIEHRLRARDRAYHHMLVRAVPILGEHDEVRQWIGIHTDITDRKKADERVAEQAALLDKANDAISVRNLDHRITYWNKGAERLFGWTREEVMGRSIRAMAYRESEPFDAAMEILLEEGDWHGELNLVGKSGRQTTVETSWTLVRDDAGQPRSVLVINTDITERKKAAKRLLANEALLRQFIQHTPAAIAMLDRNMRYVHASKRWIDDYHLANQDIIGKSHYEIFPDIPERWKAIHQRVLAGAVESCDEDPFPRVDGTTDWLQWEARPWRNAKGEIGGIIFFTQVITARKRSELELIESRQRLSLATKAANMGVWDWEIDSGRLIWDARMIALYGLQEGNFVPSLETWRNALHPADRARAEAELQASLEDGQDFHTEFRVVWPNQEVHYIESHATVQKGPDGKVLRMTGINWDNTERKRLELQFLRSQRMESIGTLAGGIAHDLNNSLTPIIMSLEMLQMYTTDDSSQELLATVSASAQRAADMVRQVLTFARGVEGDRIEVQIKHIIKEVEKIANDTFLKNILVRTFIAKNLWHVTGDPTQLHQVLLNLTVNARDAMPDGGTLTISAQNIDMDEVALGPATEARPGPYVFLQVEDSGIGMPPELIDKIFDPFFTTKEIGQGTGLGLSTSQAIVKSHGGFIRVYSEPGVGSKFKVYLPATTYVAGGSTSVESDLPRGHNELILVVDDESAVREITRQTLETFGYRVLLACDGSEALTVYAARGAEIAVVLTDMMMPIMDGPSTIRVLRKMNPAIRIIGASGLTANGHVTRSASLGVKHFLPKPYSAKLLLQTLRDILKNAE